MHSILQPHLSMSLFFQVLMTKSDTKSTCFENYTVITKKEKNSNPTFYNKLINSFSSSPNSRRMIFFFLLIYCIAFLILLLSFVQSQAPETTHSCVRLIGLIDRLLRTLHWHFAVASGFPCG